MAITEQQRMQMLQALSGQQRSAAQSQSQSPAAPSQLGALAAIGQAPRMPQQDQRGVRNAQAAMRAQALGGVAAPYGAFGGGVKQAPQRSASGLFAPVSLGPAQAAQLQRQWDPSKVRGTPSWQAAYAASPEGQAAARAKAEDEAKLRAQIMNALGTVAAVEGEGPSWYKRGGNFNPLNWL